MKNNIQLFFSKLIYNDKLGNFKPLLFIMSFNSIRLNDNTSIFLENDHDNDYK